MAKIYLRKVEDTYFCSYKGLDCYFHKGFCTVADKKEYDCLGIYVFIRVYPENDFKIPE